MAEPTTACIHIKSGETHLLRLKEQSDFGRRIVLRHKNTHTYHPPAALVFSLPCYNFT